MVCKVDFDANKRIDPVLNDTNFISNETIKRVASLALPIISLNSRTSSLVSVGMGICQSWTILTDLVACYRLGSWGECGKKTVHLTIVTSTTALAIISPLGQFAIANSIQFVTEIYNFIRHLYSSQWKESGKDTLRLLHVSIYVASCCLGGPELLALSLCIQTAVEIYKAHAEYSEHGLAHLPEVITNLLLAAVRAKSVVPHLQTLNRNYLGKQLTQAQWESIYSEMRQKTLGSNSLIDVESLLIEKNISSHIKRIDFKKTALLTNLCFKDIHFRDCDFKGAYFVGSRFHRVSADSCLFAYSSWIGSLVTDSYFSRCDFTSAALVHAGLSNVHFSDTQLKLACFNDSLLDSPIFKNCKMLETSFLGAAVTKGSLIRSDLTDCLLLDTKEHFEIRDCTPHKITKPIIGFGWNFQSSGIFAPIIFEALRDNEAIPLRFEHDPGSIDFNLLDREIRTEIPKIQQNKSGDFLSIPDALLKRAKMGSETAKIQDKAISYIKHMDGLALPGGEDIHPEFYGAEKESGTHTDLNYRHSMMEFAMISQAHKNKVAMMGTCRGAQAINVYFGGTLKQHVGEQIGLQQMEIADSSRKEWIKQLVGEEFMGFSAHHQAADQMGKDLEVVLQAEGITKLFMSKDGLILGCQIHPETYWMFQKTVGDDLSEMPEMQSIIEKNRNIYRHFVASAL